MSNKKYWHKTLTSALLLFISTMILGYFLIASHINTEFPSYELPVTIIDISVYETYNKKPIDYRIIVEDTNGNRYAFLDELKFYEVGSSMSINMLEQLVDNSNIVGFINESTGVFNLDDNLDSFQYKDYDFALYVSCIIVITFCFICLINIFDL